jgi:hypothetical protein
MASSDDITPTPVVPLYRWREVNIVPEVPTWMVILIFFVGLDLTGYKNGRKNRPSLGIE